MSEDPGSRLSESARVERVETIELYTPAQAIVKGVKDGLWEMRRSVSELPSATRTEVQEQLLAGRAQAEIRRREIVELGLTSPTAAKELAQELMDVTLASVRLERASTALRGMETDRAASILRVAEGAQDLGAMAQALQREVAELSFDGKKALLDALEDRRYEVKRERAGLEERVRSSSSARYPEAQAAERRALGKVEAQAERVETIYLIARAAIREDRRPPERGLER